MKPFYELLKQPLIRLQGTESYYVLNLIAVLIVIYVVRNNVTVYKFLDKQ